MPSLAEILGDANLNGVYRIDSLPDDLAVAAPALIRLDASACANRDDLLAALGFVLDFPDYYGVNWDALEECLFDLSWWHGPVQLLIEHAGALSTEDQAILADVWGEAASAWKELDRSFVLLLQGGGLADLPQV